MKANFNYLQRNNGINNNLLMRKHKLATEHKYKADITRENRELNRPARAISFGGSAGLTKTATKAFNKTVEFVNDNEAAYNAIYSLIVAGMLKPLFVLNMPGSEDKDKQIVATKNFLQAFIGCFLSYTVGGKFVKKAIDVVKTNFDLIKVNKETDTIEAIKAESAKALEMAKEALAKEGKKNPTIDEIIAKSKVLVSNFEKNHLKAFQKNPEFTKLLKSGAENAKSGTSFMEAFNVFWKNFTGAFTAIGKAKISSLLLPSVMMFLFAKKNLEREMQEKAKQEALTSKLTDKENHFKQMMKKENSTVAFKGNILNSAIDGTATLIEKGGMSKFGERVAKLLSNAKKPSARMSDIESFAITAYWLQNTARSKKIEPSQKLGLNVHTALVTAISSTAAFLIDSALDGLIDKSKTRYSEQLEKIVKNIKNNPALEVGKTLDETLQHIPNMNDAIKMGIKDKVLALLDAKQTKEGLAEITDADIEEIINSLKSTKAFEGFDLNKNLIEDAIESLKKSEPIRKEILKQAEDLIGAKEIAKKLSRAIGDTDRTTKEIAKLSGKYAKKLSKFKSLTIFTLVVRFLVPVLMVPFSGKLKKKIIEWTDGKPNTPKTQKA